ncbi:hypothetical protein MPSEU_000868400 [Mayamaea pseudoterrestris]|nr:hypothetical protein MPSEU_000868400 [Mayamaea pseudoterrestris]
MHQYSPIVENDAEDDYMNGSPLLQLALLSLVLVHSMSWFFVNSPASSSPTKQSDDTSPSPLLTHHSTVPFIFITKPDWRILHKLLVQHEREQQRLLSQSSRSLQVMLQSQADYSLPPILSRRTIQRMDKMASLMERDLELLQSKILVAFQYTLALPAAVEELDAHDDASQRNEHNYLQDTTSNHLGYYTKSTSAENTVYDAGTQIVAHLVRDWSSHGQVIRRNLYDWCVDQLPVQQGNGNDNDGNMNSSNTKTPLSILVPGAGLGRLAYELAKRGHVVHAVEMSLGMAAAASCIFGNDATSNNTLELHPYVMDALTNEVDSELRYAPVTIERADLTLLPRGASLSYTVSDFCTLPMPQQSYDVVVTCFFLDTATNMYDYIHKIYNALAVNGTWINVGPLQWHANAQVLVSANELRELIMSMGFYFASWSIDEQPMEYRSCQKMRSTHYDAYRPVRFVAIKQ